MFEAKLICDGNGCHEELDLNIEHPDDSVMEVERAENKGWDYDWDSGFAYCPKCKLIVEEERNES